MADQIKVGDVVQLKSGGPLMTVEIVDADRAFCTWFTNNEKRREPFQLAALQVAEA